MMKLKETVGNIKVYTRKFKDNSIEINFLNGSDIVVKETYFNTTEENAIADLFNRELDTYTEEWLWLNLLTDGLEKLTDNTYKHGNKDYFCIIDNTRYLKHFNKTEEEFIKDKNGERIINR